MLTKALRWVTAVLTIGVACQTVSAQLPNPDDFDLLIRVEQEGNTVRGIPGAAVRAPRVQGWSYGVRHDTSLLTLDSITIEGNSFRLD